MSDFDNKYKTKEDSKTIDFHKSRRMFVIFNDKLIIAEPNLPYSHAVWFEKEGWMKDSDDSFMNTVTRGVVNAQGDICFYVKYDFELTAEAEKEFFKFLPQLVKELGIKDNGLVSGGQIKQPPGIPWTHRKEYGTVEQCLNNNLYN